MTDIQRRHRESGRANNMKASTSTCNFFWYRTVIHWSEDEARLKLGFKVDDFKDTFVSLEMPTILRHQHVP